jgi:hypothetical protein
VVVNPVAGNRSAPRISDDAASTTSLEMCRYSVALLIKWRISVLIIWQSGCKSRRESVGRVYSGRHSRFKGSSENDVGTPGSLVCHIIRTIMCHLISKTTAIQTSKCVLSLTTATSAAWVQRRSGLMVDLCNSHQPVVADLLFHVDLLAFNHTNEPSLYCAAWKRRFVH